MKMGYCGKWLSRKAYCKCIRLEMDKCDNSNMELNSESQNKISFLVPTLGNRGKEIKRLFDSLIKQSYNNIEVVLVIQDNYASIEALCLEYRPNLDITIIKSDEKGLSKARNRGVAFCKGDIIALSDDDCWYPSDAAKTIINEFNENNVSVLLTQIYDFDNKQNYKAYKQENKMIRSAFSLFSRSSIEIAFLKEAIGTVRFDELFGLGAHFVCCEEVDFLIKLFRNNKKILYSPIITVYHAKKNKGSTRKQVVAKGAIYAKEYNVLVGLLICVKDLLLRKENNFIPFFEGFNEYKVYKRTHKTNDC